MAEGAKLEGRDVERWSKTVRPETVRAVHERLGKAQVVLDPEADADQLRALFATIRDKRNDVARIITTLIPRVALLRADLVRIDRAIEADSSDVMDSGRGLLGTKNADQRKARIKVVLCDLYDQRAEVKSDLALVEEAVSSAKVVREELRFAFEEASRALASIELEYRIERSTL